MRRGLVRRRTRGGRGLHRQFVHARLHIGRSVSRRIDLHLVRQRRQRLRRADGLVQTGRPRRNRLHLYVSQTRRARRRKVTTTSTIASGSAAGGAPSPTPHPQPLLSGGTRPASVPPPVPPVPLVPLVPPVPPVPPVPVGPASAGGVPASTT